MPLHDTGRPVSVEFGPNEVRLYLFGHLAMSR
jgi:hypothetical protein